MKKKAVTIEDLARMVAKGFGETAGKEQVDNLERWAKLRLDNVDRELKAIQKQLTGIVYRYEFDRLQDRVKDLEGFLAVGSKKR